MDLAEIRFVLFLIKDEILAWYVDGPLSIDEIESLCTTTSRRVFYILSPSVQKHVNRPMWNRAISNTVKKIILGNL